MTDDTSPENLHKFLESDDPALIGMGLSMAKGSADSSGETLGMVLGLYLFHGDKNIRSLDQENLHKIGAFWSKEDCKRVLAGRIQE